METGTGLTILGTALGEKDIIIKQIGLTADYIGGGLKIWYKINKDIITYYIS